MASTKVDVATLFFQTFEFSVFSTPNKNVTPFWDRWFKFETDRQNLISEDRDKLNISDEECQGLIAKDTSYKPPNKNVSYGACLNSRPVFHFIRHVVSTQMSTVLIYLRLTYILLLLV